MGFTMPRVRYEITPMRTMIPHDRGTHPPVLTLEKNHLTECPTFCPSFPAVSRLFAPPRSSGARTPLGAAAPSRECAVVTIRTQHALEKMFTMSTSMTTLKARVAAKAVAVRVLDRPRESRDARARERGARDAEGILTRDQYLARRGIARALSTMVIVGGGGCAVCGTSGGENGR